MGPTVEFSQEFYTPVYNMKVPLLITPQPHHLDWLIIRYLFLVSSVPTFNACGRGFTKVKLKTLQDFSSNL